MDGVLQRIPPDDLLVEGSICNGHRLLERRRARKVRERAGRRGDRNTADRGDLVRLQGCAVHVQIATPVTAGGAVAGDVHPIQRKVPHRQPVQHGGRHVADDRDRGELSDSCTYRQQVPRLPLAQPFVDRGDVRAAAHALDLPASS